MKIDNKTKRRRRRNERLFCILW